MRIVRRLFLVLALLFAAPSLALAQAPDEAARVERANARGKLIYDFDQAAWHSTDVLLKKLPQGRRPELRGWVVEPDGDALSVLYFGLDGDKPYGLFEARFSGGKVISSREIKPGQPRDLTPRQQRMSAARGALTGLTVRPCTRGPFNTVILPPESDAAPVEVYVLSPQVTVGEYPFGGHFLVAIGADGKIASSRPFMKSCLNNSVPPNAFASMVSHMLDPTPTEIHVWLAWWTGKPVFVMVTETGQLWEVSTTGMRKVDKPGG